MGLFTTVLQLYKWAATDQKLLTFQEYNNNADKLEVLLAPLKAPTFTNLTLQNGAAVASGRTPRYTKIGKEITLEGEITNVAAGTQIATLPTFYRPPALRIFKTALNSSLTNDGASIYIDTTGAVVVLAVGNATNTISLCGIKFFSDL